MGGGRDRFIVVVDILRVTTALCTDFGYGVNSMIPFGSIIKAREMKKQGWLFAGSMADLLTRAFYFVHDCDAAATAMLLWQKSSGNLLRAVNHSSHYLRLLGIETSEGLR